MVAGWNSILFAGCEGLVDSYGSRRLLSRASPYQSLSEKDGGLHIQRLHSPSHQSVLAIYASHAQPAVNVLA